MFKIHLVTAIRQIRRFTSLSAITIVGLAAGFTTVILLSIWIHYEFQFDRFYEKTDRIYKVFLEEPRKGSYDNHPWVPFPIAKALRDEIPEIENSTIITDGSIKVKHDDLIFYENKACFTDAQLFDVFDLKFIRGNKESALHRKESIVISERIAKKYFRDENPIRKMLQVNDNYSFEVTAVVADAPKNSSFSFDFFILAEYFAEPFIFNGTNWEALNFNSYVCLQNNANPDVVRSKIRDILMKHVPERERYLNMQPIKDAHFYSVSGAPTNIKNIRIMGILGLVIYIVALFNFLTISIGRYQKRAFEFKTKGIIGAGKMQVFSQIFIECLSIISIATVLSIILSVLVLPLAERLAGLQFTSDMVFSRFLLKVIGVAVISALFIGTVPLLIIFKRYLKFSSANEGKQPKAKFAYQSFFVILQFASSILLIIGVIVVTLQLNYISKREIGLNPENVIVAPLKGAERAKYPVLKEELMRNTAVKSVTAAYNLPTNIGTQCVITSWPGNPYQERLELAYTVVDKDYFSTLGMNIIQGVPFSEKQSSDSVAYIVNEQAVAAMHLKEPVGAEIDFSCWTKGKIIGVVKDFNYRSVHSRVEPLIIVNHLFGAQNLLVKLTRTPDQAILADLEKTWKEINPQSPFGFQPLNNSLVQMYQADQRFKNLLFTCSTIAIILSAIGLFGLIFMHVQRKIKEIGIRKVNGAKISEILTMLNKDFIKWVAIAFVVATPIAYYAMHKWLENFAYKTKLSWWIFALAGLVALGIALLTVSWQSWRAATRNPVEAMRYE
jgi:putative ABC transport system permease protein